jgi:F-type H+-transporting ATPase subunit delta
MLPNPRLAGRYAKSLIDLAIEKGQLDAVYSDMQYLQILCNNREFVNLLKSPVIKADKKAKILDALTTGKIGVITATFNKLLLRKGRESILPEVIAAFIGQYKEHMGIHTVKLTTAAPVSEELKNSILDRIRTAMSLKNLELDTAVDEGIIGGFILEIGDRLVDASIAYDLNNIKKQFQNNDFIYKIR